MNSLIDLKQALKELSEQAEYVKTLQMTSQFGHGYKTAYEEFDKLLEKVKLHAYSYKEIDVEK